VIDVEVLVKVTAEWGEHTTTAEVMADLNAALLAAVEALSYMPPRGFVAEVSLNNYSFLRQRQAMTAPTYPWGARPFMTLMDYVLRNNLAAANGVGIRFVVAAEGL